MKAMMLAAVGGMAMASLAAMPRHPHAYQGGQGKLSEFSVEWRRRLSQRGRAGRRARDQARRQGIIQIADGNFVKV